MPKHHNVACLLFVVLGLAGCEFTKEGDPSDGPCGKRCEGELPYCNQDLKECVACLDNTHCTETGKPLCQTSTGKCGACLSEADCTDPDKAHCNAETLVCEYPCQEDADCEGLAGTEACGPDDVCVECTPTNETVCDGKICVPDTNSCSEDIEQGETPICSNCVSDTQCVADHKCIPLEYNDAFHGNYCMKLASATCANPYRAPELQRKSVLAAEDDEPEAFCGINEALTTCEAVLGFDQECPGGTDAECGAQGAICRKVNNATNHCTYHCEDALQCTPSAACAGSGDPIANDRYCGN